MKRSKQRGNADLDREKHRSQPLNVARKKIRISADLEVLTRIDILVRERKFRSRSEFFNIALAEKLSQHSEHSLATECEKLDPTEEQELAEIGLHSDLIIFPKY